MSRISLPSWFRAEGMLLPWRSISDLQHEGRVLPEELTRQRKSSVAERHTEVHLRWACDPSIGVPLSPFKVWMRSISSRVETVSLNWTIADGEMRATLPGSASRVAVELQRSSQTEPISVYGLLGGGDLRRAMAAKSIRLSTNERTTLTLSGDGITSLVILNGTNPVVRMQAMSDTINDPAWKLVEQVGLPVDGSWGSSAYSHADQGIIGAEMNPLEAAKQRLDRGAPPFGWPFFTQMNQLAPAWAPIHPDKLMDELHSELMPMLEKCFSGVLSSDQVKIRPVLNVDPPQQGGRQSSAKTTAALSPIQLLLLAATTEPALALACGFGTAWPLESDAIAGLSPQKTEFLVTGLWKGNPVHGDMELASFVPWPDVHQQLMKPAGLFAERDGLVRPQVTDAQWRESVKIQWNRVENTAALGRPTSCSFARFDVTTIPQTESLMPIRESGGWRPFVITADAPEGQINADKNALVDSAVPLPLDGQVRHLGYAVAVQDIFGIWSPWSDAVHSDQAPRPPGLGLISTQLDTRYNGAASACPSELDLQLAIDWSSRRPRRFELFIGFYPMSNADSPTPATLAPDLPISAGMFNRQLTVNFNGDSPDTSSVRALDAEGLNFVTAGPQQGMDIRRYRMELPVPELDFSATRRWGVRIWGRLESRVIPGFSQWGPPGKTDGTAPSVAVAVAASPAPITPLPLSALPGVPMGSQTDGSGRSHVKVYWSLPSGIRPQKINVWEITESVMRQRASLEKPEPGTLPGARLQELREAYDAMSRKDRRTGFRRLLELPGTAREVDIALPRGSSDIHLYTITTTTDTGIESPWPEGSAEERLHAFIAPTLVSPAAPLVRASVQGSGSLSIDLVSASAIPVREYRLYRSLCAEAAQRTGSMGPPFAVVSATPATPPDETDSVTGQPLWHAAWQGSFPENWQDWLVRVVAVPVDSIPDAAIRGQASLPSDILSVAVRPQTAPDLEPLTHDVWGATHNGVIVESSTALRFTQSPSGAHRMIAKVGNDTLVVDDINDIPIDDDTIPNGARPGPVLIRRTRTAGRTPLAIVFERADRLQSVEMDLKLIDPLGRVSSERTTVPPWIQQPLSISILDVLTISGRGKVLMFSADAPVDSRDPGQMSITATPPRLNLNVRPTTERFALHKIPFDARPTFANGNDKLRISRTNKLTPYIYALFIRSGDDDTVLISIEMDDGRKGSVLHKPRRVINPVNPFEPPLIVFPPGR